MAVDLETLKALPRFVARDGTAEALFTNLALERIWERDGVTFQERCRVPQRFATVAGFEEYRAWRVAGEPTEWSDWWTAANGEQ